MFKDKDDAKKHGFRAELAAAVKNKDKDHLEKITTDYMKERDLAKNMSWGQWLGYGALSVVKTWRWDPNGEMIQALKDSLSNASDEDLNWIADTLGINKEDLTIEKIDPKKAGGVKLFGGMK